MNRDSTIFYRSFYEAIKELPEANQLEIYNAIFEHSLNLNKPNLTGLSKTIYTLIEPQIEANLKRYTNGIKPKKKQIKSEEEAKPKQNESESEANKNKNKNKNVNNNDNDNEKEKFIFKNALLNYGFDSDLVKDWLVVRKNKKCSNTETAFNGFISQVEKTKLDKNAVLKKCIEKSWGGFESDWIKGVVTESEIGQEESYTGNWEVQTISQNGKNIQVLSNEEYLKLIELCKNPNRYPMTTIEKAAKTNKQW